MTRIRAHTFKTQFTTGILSMTLAGAVTAGQLEDGVAAHKRQHYVTAMRLWRPLADAGNAEAQANIGVLYRDAQGVPPGYEIDAYMWFSLAAAGGNKKAATERDTIAKGMTAAQITEAQRRVREWQPKR